MEITSYGLTIAMEVLMFMVTVRIHRLSFLFVLKMDLKDLLPSAIILLYGKTNVTATGTSLATIY